MYKSFSIVTGESKQSVRTPPYQPYIDLLGLFTVKGGLAVLASICRGTFYPYLSSLVS